MVHWLQDRKHKKSGLSWFYIFKGVWLLSLYLVLIGARNMRWVNVCHAISKHGMMTKCTSYITWYFYSSCPIALLTTDICGCSHSLSFLLFLPRPCCWSFILRVLRSCSVQSFNFSWLATKLNLIKKAFRRIFCALSSIT